MHEALAQAAAEILGRLARDAEKAPPTVRKMLEEIETRLFEPGFSASKLRLARNPEAVTAFCRMLGINPRDYVALSRTLVAARLLMETDLSQEAISHLVGIRATNTLRHYFYRFFDCPPGKIRSEVLKARQEGRPVMPSLGTYWLFSSGNVDSSSAKEVVDRLDALDCAAGRVLPACQPELELSDNEGILGVQIDALLLHPKDERLRLLRRGVYRGTVDVFEALSRRSRIEGRVNRRRGVELAELALAVAEGNAELWGRKKPDYLALGWARLSNARRVASDLDEAELAMRRAETWASRAVSPTRVKAEVAGFKGALRLFQRRLAEALDALNEAIAISQVAKAEPLLVDALLQRASLHLYRGEPGEAMPDLLRVQRLIPAADKRRRLGAVQQLVGAAFVAGDNERARKHLPEAQRLSAEIGDAASSFQNQWFAGLLLREDGKSKEAESVLKEARAGFLDIGERDMSAIVSLDLALLCQEQRRSSEVMSYASDALPALESLRLPEALYAFDLLSRAISEGQLHHSVLELARSRLLMPGLQL